MLRLRRLVIVAHTRTNLCKDAIQTRHFATFVTMKIFEHPLLGPLRGTRIDEHLTQFRSIPYATIEQRFARSKLLTKLPREGTFYDASAVGPSSIQPFGGEKMDAGANQLPSDIIKEEQSQSEDCLRLTITVPTDKLKAGEQLPVVVFIHGGAFFLNSGERPYYSPSEMCNAALEHDLPIIFVSINYRLGALGFLHSSSAADLIPANNGLHDQLRAFEWIHKYIDGFGGNPVNITAIGQSAGAESIALHNISGQKTPLYKRSITFSGTPVTMPAKTPAEHEENFRQQAQKLGIKTEDRSSAQITHDMIKTPVDKIRDLGFVGAPCSQSEMMPYERPTMELSRSGPADEVGWLDSQIVSGSGYDGSISYIITKKNPKRRNHAKSFIAIAREVMKKPDELFALYDIGPGDSDEDTLKKICRFESDIGFIIAADAVAKGARKTRTYLQLFDLPNPFEGYLERGRYTTHCWDIVALLGAYEDRLSSQYVKVIGEWRRQIIAYCVSGEEPWRDCGTGHGLSITKVSSC